MKKLVFCIAIFLLLSDGFGYYPPITHRLYSDKSVQSPLTEVTDKPAFFWFIHWTGVGNLSDWVISNTGQSGIFPQPPGCEYFDGTWRCIWYSLDLLDALGYGLTGEYPAGSGQFYCWAAGMWVGALYPIVEGEDTTWQKRVSKSAYYSDLGAMSAPEMMNAGEAGDLSEIGMYTSTQILPHGYGHEHEGEFLFPQPGYAKEDWQAEWPFTDTMINRRRPIGSEVEIGDIISMDDTYACYGDWINPDDAACIWIRDAGPYDVWGLGVRVEQRTYSWNYDYNNAYIYINYKIRNMNNFPLDSVYLGFFMDNDIGSGITEPNQGAEDDMIGFDKELNLGYSYDSDGYEPGWATPAGYIGCVMLETPEDLGLTGFQTWQRNTEIGDLIDEDAQDSLKYDALATRIFADTFMVFTKPKDVRQLSCTGPYPRLEPGEEIEFTVAVVVGLTLDELRKRAEFAKGQFGAGYLGFSPPPGPKVTLTPGDGKVYISWDGAPSESYECPFSKEHTFEGYRIYRSLTALPEDWELLADYDIAGSTTKDTVIGDLAVGPTTAELNFVKYHDDYQNRGVFADDANFEYEYLITFCCPCVESVTVWDTLEIIDSAATLFELYNVTAGHEGKLYYNPDAESEGEGYCIIDPVTGEAYPDEGYRSGSWIYFDGVYVKITNAEFDSLQPGKDRIPSKGDVYKVDVYDGHDVGAQAGLRYYYVDETVTNGVTYYYTVTAYSREIPTFGVASLESGKTGKTYWCIPRKEPVDYEGAFAEVHQDTGIGNVDSVLVKPVQPKDVTGHEYKISFLPKDDSSYYLLPDTGWLAGYWRLTDLTSDSIVLDSVTAINGEHAVPIVDGLLITIDVVEEPAVDTANTGWIVGRSTYELAIAKIDTLFPYDYEIEISDTGSYDMRGNLAPFVIMNKTLNAPVSAFAYKDSDGDSTLSLGDEISIIANPTGPPPPLLAPKWIVTIDPAEPDTIPPQIGDIWRLQTFKPTTTLDEFVIETSIHTTPKSDWDLDKVRVVPNPYYIRAAWDVSKYARYIYFQGLPSKCTIRIFNTAGLLIKTIEHDETNTAATFSSEASTGAGAHRWDLLTEEGLNTVSGLYIYQVTTPDGKEKVGKFAIIR